jgi:glycogen debranching enzyme
VLAWSEWNHWLTMADRNRLERVFPALVGYHRWTRFYRTWQDRTYWNTGWGCGMDNQPRVKPWPEGNVGYHHGFMSWIDATAQALLSARTIGRMAGILNRSDVAADMHAEADHLADVIHTRMWNEQLGAYVDCFRNGAQSDVLTVGGLWMLLDEELPAERLARLTSLLRDPAHLARPHMVPSLSAAHPLYDRTGGYWRGAVWPPTNLMVLRGLHLHAQDELAHTIARNHLDNVTRVFTKTNTVWENYSPEVAEPGKPARDDFTGWGGLGPVAILMEGVFGLRPDVPSNRLVWDIRLLEEHGVEQYPFGKNATLRLRAGARTNPTEEPRVDIQSDAPLTVELRWAGGSKKIAVGR